MSKKQAIKRWGKETRELVTRGKIPASAPQPQISQPQVNVATFLIKECQEEAAAMAAHGNSNYPSMSYEEGVDAALRWVLGESVEHPMRDE
jgi:hypothetical protein